MIRYREREYLLPSDLGLPLPIGLTGHAVGAEAAGALADRLGSNLVAAWKEKALRPEVELQMNAFKERMKNLVTYRPEEWRFEYEYWRKIRD